MKLLKKYSSAKIRKFTDDYLLKFANTLKQEKDKFKQNRILQSDDFNLILNDILTYQYKKEHEIYILNTYLRSLSKFMNIINFTDNNTVIENFLSKISSNLQSAFFEKNSMLMRIGDLGDYFYIILKGSVSVLVTKVISIHLSHEKFTEHLKILYNNEPYLFKGTIKLNRKGPYFLNFNEIKVYDKKYVIKKLPSLNDYISLISGDRYINESSKYHSEVKLMCYFKVTELNKGNSFGEIALIDCKQKRTASIFVNENSFFGILSSKDYNNSMKKIQEQIKRDNINFVFNTQLFNQISLNYFTQSYWNYFIHRRIYQGDYIFKENFHRDEIYFIYEGEIKITCHLNLEKIQLILSNLLPYYKYDKYKNYNQKFHEITISFGKKGQILGMGDLLIKDKYFCNAICKSKTLDFFAIDINIFLLIAKSFNDIYNSFKKLEDKKIKIMVKRLKTVEFTLQHSFIEEKVVENHIVTKTGKEINFDDWFDCKKNFSLKTSRLKKKRVLIDFDKIEHINSFYPSQEKNRVIGHKSTMPFLKKNITKNHSVLHSLIKQRNKSLSFVVNRNNKKNEKSMVISLKSKENLNPSLIKFNTRNPPKISISEYNNEKSKNISLQNYLNLNKLNNDGRRNPNNSHSIVKNIVFAEHKVVTKLLKKEKRNYLDLLKNSENNNDLSIYEKLSSFSKRIKSEMSILSDLYIKRSLNVNNIDSYREKNINES